jgi:hypothetical protein
LNSGQTGYLKPFLWTLNCRQLAVRLALALLDPSLLLLLLPLLFMFLHAGTGTEAAMGSAHADMVSFHSHAPQSPHGSVHSM